jgi:hypothetical protein
MSTFSVVKRLFNAGELSPKVYGRSDLDKWSGGCKTLLNFLPLPQGGVQRRPGIEFITSAKNNGNDVRLIPFQFSSTQAYIIEAGNSYFRFYMNGGQILGNNNAAYEVAHNYTQNDLSTIQYTQSFDTLYLTHKNHHPKQLTRTDHNNWTFGNVSFTFNNNSTAPVEWSANNGYPRTCTFYQDRLVFASSTLFPSRIWISKTGNYTNMTTGTNDADGMTLNLLSGTSDVIYWLTSGKTILAGTDAGIQSILAGSATVAALSPTNKKNQKESYFGTSEVMPVKLGDVVIYAGNPASKVRELSFSWEADAYQSGELSVLSDHLLQSNTVREFAYQQSPYEIVWCLRSDNTLLALTYMQEQRVVAWSRHNTNGNICSIATIPGNYETELWMAVHRNINNNTATYIERLSTFLSKNWNASDFLDSYVSLTNPSNFTYVSVPHLANETVQYFAGGVAGQTTVTDNNAAVPSCTSAKVGLQYVSDLEPLIPEPELKSGAMAYKTLRVTEMAISCRNSAGGTYGPDANTQTALFANNAFTNGKVDNLSIRGGHGIDQGVFIRQSDPLPMNIDMLGLEIEVE